jgi:lipopolysaccharide exporter
MKKGQIASGVGWMALFKLVDRGLAIVSTLVLARLLVPADFGLVAMAMSVIAILELASAFSFDVPLIQRPQVDRTYYDSAWTLNAALAMVCAGATAALAYPTAAFYEEPRLAAVMLVLAIGWVFSAFENVGTVDFRRQLNFRREFYFLAAKRASSFAITMTLAFALRSYWALVIGTVSARALGLALSYLLHPFRPRFSLQHARELFGFSSWLLVNNVLQVMQAKAAHFAVGRLLGPQALGLYTVGAELAQIPTNDMLAPINRVVFPSFSRLNGDLVQLRAAFLSVVSVTTMVALPAAVGIAAVAEPLVLVLLGPNWADAAEVVRILALSAAATAVTSINGSVNLALGQPRLITFAAALRVALLIPLAWVFVAHFGLLGAAYAELLAVLAGLGVSIALALSRLKLVARVVFARLWRQIVASLAMGYLVYELVYASERAHSSLTALPILLVAVATGIATYVFFLAVLWWACGRPAGAERTVLEFIQQRLWSRPWMRLLP